VIEDSKRVVFNEANLHRARFGIERPIACRGSADRPDPGRPRLPIVHVGEESNDLLPGSQDGYVNDFGSLDVHRGFSRLAGREVAPL
jgi:hypothetical protein